VRRKIKQSVYRDFPAYQWQQALQQHVVQIEGDKMTNRRTYWNWIQRVGLKASNVAGALSIALVMAAVVVQSSAAQTFKTLHVFTGSPDGAFSQAPVVRDANGNLYGTTTSGGNGSGTVFKVDKNGLESILYTFRDSSRDGIFPSSSLLLDAAGNLYGTALGGPGAGVLFRVDKNGNEETLHDFEGGAGSDAAVPSGGVIRDEAGNFYGVTLFGRRGFGALYQIDPSGTLTVLHDFDGKSDGARPQGTLARDADGNFYGVAVEGGRKNKGTVFKLASNGEFTVLHTFTGGKDGSGPQGGLLLDSAGNLFGSAIAGGLSGNGTVFEITKAGRFKRLYSFTGGIDGAAPNAGLVQDPDGNIYGTTQIGPDGFFLGTVFKLSRTRVLTVLHTFAGLEDGAVPIAGVIRDSSGTLYGTTVRNFLIQPIQGGSVFKIKP
jgi:uncharacterized repeat protein (TIGR03803 family)